MAGFAAGDRSVPALASATVVGAVVGAMVLWPNGVGDSPPVEPVTSSTTTSMSAPVRAVPAGTVSVAPESPVDAPPVTPAVDPVSAPEPAVTTASPPPVPTSRTPRRTPTPTLRTPMSVSPTPRTAFPNQPGGTGDGGSDGGLLPGVGLGPL